MNAFETAEARQAACMPHIQGMLLDALKPETAQSLAAEMKEILKLTGVKTELTRSSGQNQFYMYLVTEKGMSIDEVFNLDKNKTLEEIRDLFDEFKTDLKTNFVIGPEAARRMGARQRKMVDLIEREQFPDKDPASLEEMISSLEKFSWLHSLMLDMGQDTAQLSAIGYKSYNAERANAFYEGFGGKELFNRKISRVQGALYGATLYSDFNFPTAVQPERMTERFAMFRDAWPQYRGKTVADVEAPGLCSQSLFSRKMSAMYKPSFDGTGAYTLPEQFTPQEREEAERYLSGDADTFAGKDKLLADIAAVRRDVTESINKELRSVGYKFGAMHIDAQPTLDYLEQNPDFGAMTGAQRAKVSELYSSYFIGKLDDSFLDPLYGAGKDLFDIIKVDGKSLRDIAATEGSAALPDDLAREQMMQFAFLCGMADPDHKLTIEFPQIDADHRITGTYEAEVSPQRRELRLDVTDPYFRDVNLVAAANSFLMEGPQSISEHELDALREPFARMQQEAVTPEMKAKLKGFGKDVYDCVFINGRSVNQIMQEDYPQGRSHLRDTLIAAYRMDPESRIEYRPVDMTADEFKLKDPVMIGARKGIPGLSDEAAQRITDGNLAAAGFKVGAARADDDPTTSAQASGPATDSGSERAFTASVTMDKVKRIDEIYYKMHSEGFSLHFDSSQYKAMKKAVDAVHDAAATYDPTDPAFRKNMEKLFADLEDKAGKYAEKEAYNKNKKTSRGVERKNTALSILDTISASVREQDVIDTRLSKSDPKGTKRTFKELMAEEKKAVSTAHGQHAQSARIQKRHQAAKTSDSISKG